MMLCHIFWNLSSDHFSLFTLLHCRLKTCMNLSMQTWISVFCSKSDKLKKKNLSLFCLNSINRRYSTSWERLRAPQTFSCFSRRCRYVIRLSVCPILQLIRNQVAVAAALHRGHFRAPISVCSSISEAPKCSQVAILRISALCLNTVALECFF